MEERISVDLVTGNSSWWKARKFRRETAATLQRYRSEGWRLVRIERLAANSVDTRRLTRYTLRRQQTGIRPVRR
jgi:hypothetical protein